MWNLSRVSSNPNKSSFFSKNETERFDLADFWSITNAAEKNSFQNKKAISSDSEFLQ